jgi:hypothetical protein
VAVARGEGEGAGIVGATAAFVGVSAVGCSRRRITTRAPTPINTRRVRTDITPMMIFSTVVIEPLLTTIIATVGHKSQVGPPPGPRDR